MNLIDFVITWVDGNDPEWIKQKNEYNPDKSADIGGNRYRDMGLLRYWFRAVEKYAPWVNKVHFITCGHLPEWLNTDCEKLNIVKHSDYIPEKYLPTFNSHPIELHMHRIEGLAEQFVYFNDDFILNGPVTPEYYFKNGVPCDFLHAHNIYYGYTQNTYAHVQTNVANEISKKHSYFKSFMRHPFKFINVVYPLKQNIMNFLKLENKNHFIGFYDSHLPIAYTKRHFIEVWEQYEDVLDYTSGNKFRTPYDVSHNLMRYYRFAKGEFEPVSQASRGKYFNLMLNAEEIPLAILDEKYKQICINDTTGDFDFEAVSQKIVAAYEQKLPDKSMFEK